MCCNSRLTRDKFLQDRLFVVPPEPRFYAIGKCSPHLNARSACRLGLTQLFGSAVSSGQPEWQSQLAYLLDNNPVALGLDRVTWVVKLQLPARWRIVDA